jgi:hypothetical protein
MVLLFSRLSLQQQSFRVPIGYSLKKIAFAEICRTTYHATNRWEQKARQWMVHKLCSQADRVVPIIPVFSPKYFSMPKKPAQVGIMPAKISP